MKIKIEGGPRQINLELAHRIGRMLDNDQVTYSSEYEKGKTTHIVHVPAEVYQTMRPRR